MVKNLSANAEDSRDMGSIPGSERSPGGRLGNPLQYSCLENQSHGQYEKLKNMTLENEPSKSEGMQYATGEEQRAITNSSRKSEAAAPKWKRHSVVDVSGGESSLML